MDAAFSCGGLANTSVCCRGLANAAERRECIAAFRCEVDQCGSICAPNAVGCERKIEDRDFGRREAVYSCSCPWGFVGTGHACANGKIRPDSSGSPITRESILCGCHRVTIDRCLHVVCGGSARCVEEGDNVRCNCNDGFKLDHLGNCVDETLPLLQLRGPAVVQLNQCGASYEELGVLIVDENAAAYERTLSIHYSDPLDFPSRDRGGSTRNKNPYFKAGTYVVIYRIDTPWTSPPFAEAKRLVEVKDVDECETNGMIVSPL